MPESERRPSHLSEDTDVDERRPSHLNEDPEVEGHLVPPGLNEDADDAGLDERRPSH